MAGWGGSRCVVRGGMVVGDCRDMRGDVVIKRLWLRVKAWLVTPGPDYHSRLDHLDGLN